LGYDTLDKDSGGCFSSTTGGKPVGRWALLLTGLLFFRRREGTHASGTTGPH